MDCNINEQIIQLRKQKVSLKKIAETLNVSVDKVRYQCEKHGLKGIVPCNKKSEVALEIFLNQLQKKFKGMIEYVSGYTHSDEPVLLRCAICKHEFTRSAQVARSKKNTQCPACKEAKRENDNAREALRKSIKVEIFKPTKHMSEVFVIECRQCNEVFGCNKNNRVFCSVECSKRHANKKKDLRRRKTKANGDVDYSITLPKLMAKEKNTCYLCGLECDKDDHRHDSNGNFIVGPNYPSVEHVIPISKGGTHTWDNVKLAHHYCNTIKNDKELFEADGQMLLLI